MRLADVHRALTDPEPEARPQMRWWWFGPDIREADVDRQLAAMAAAGIGGVEVAFVYPLRPGSPDYLSAQPLGVLRHAAERARDLGLRFHVTLGSGWSFGGPHITPELAARGLVWERRAVQPGPGLLSTATTTSTTTGDQLVSASIMPGDLTEPLRDLEPLDIVDGAARVPDGRGPRVVLLGIVRPTGQVVKRAAAGADGPVLDHYSAEATRQHLDHVGGALLGAVPAELIESLFCDSLEAYGSNWTTDLPAEFERRRGYSFDRLLHWLIAPPPTGDDDASAADRATAFRLRADVTRTLSELYEERFVAECQHWCAARGIPFRIQGYGVPPARVGSYRFADRYEGEGWGWKTVTATRWASSAAHVDDVPIVSCETWTWIHSPSFRATPLDLRGEAHEHFLSGVNELLGHGWPHSPEGAEGLGWFFYASGALDDRNPWWPAMPALMRELQRLSAVLRRGRPHRDLILLAPSDDAAQELGQAPDGSQHLDLYRATRDRLPLGLTAAIREASLDYDLVDDTMLDRVPLDSGTVVVVAGMSTASAPVPAWLDHVREAGGQVLTVDSPGVDGTPCDVTRVAEAVSAHREPLSGPAATSPDIGVVRRDGETTDVSVVVNTGPAPAEFAWASRSRRARVEYWSPDAGTHVAAPTHLEPYEAIVVIETDEAEAESWAPAPASPEGRSTVTLDDASWTVEFPGSEPVPVTLPHRWEDSAERLRYSGSAVYETSFELPEGQGAGAAELSLGDASAWPPARRAEAETLRPQAYRAHLDPPVGEVAAVEVNGGPAGVVWAPPYRLDIGALVRPGANTMRITVFNTAANALADDPRPGELARSVIADYGRRFEFQDLDRALADVRSGLFGPVSVTFGSPDSR